MTYHRNAIAILLSRSILLATACAFPTLADAMYGEHNSQTMSFLSAGIQELLVADLEALPVRTVQ